MYVDERGGVGDRRVRGAPAIIVIKDGERGEAFEGALGCAIRRVLGSRRGCSHHWRVR